MILSLIYLCIGVFTQLVRGDFISTDFISTDYISTDYEEYNDGKLGHRPHLEYYSSNEYSPLLQVNIWNESAISQTGSHIFLRHDGNDTSPLSSPLILDANDLSAVYMNRTFDNVFGTRVQENFGKKYLTFWAGQKGEGVGNGFGLAYDDTYRLTYKVWARNISVHSDLHEFAFTGHGTALVTAVDEMTADASDWEGWTGPSKFRILDSLFQEIDLETNEVLFSWRALDHLDPMDSFEPLSSHWDVFHMNSIQKTQAGNYLISVRHIHSILLIDGRTGDIIWTLGGKRNDFKELLPAEGVNPIAPLLTMGWQHHARYVPGTNETQMTFFDNHIKTTTHGECVTNCSRGLHIAIDDTSSPPTVQLLREYLHPSRLQAQSQGSVQPLDSVEGDLGNVFIGWGRCPTFTEHTSSGDTIMDVQFSPWHSTEVPDALDNYRAYKMDWSATPWWDPEIALRKNLQGEHIVFVSWNGATTVREWVVRGAVSVSDVDGMVGDVLARSPRMGFETMLVIEKTASRYVWADALDEQGNVLRSTEVLNMHASNISVIISDSDKSDSMTQTWVFVGTSLGTFVLVAVAGILIWRRRGGYNRLEGDDIDLEPNRDIASDFELDNVSHSIFREPWEDYMFPEETQIRQMSEDS